MEYQEEIKRRLLEAADKIKEYGLAELLAQGHRASGRLEASFRTAIIKATTNVVQAGVMFEDYGLKLDTGVSAAEVRSMLASNSAGGGSYVQGLINWSMIVRPSLSPADRQGFVNTVTSIASRTGHPTPGSYAFSSNGRRKGWIKWTLEGKRDEIKRILHIEDLVTKYFYNSVKETLEGSGNVVIST